MATSASLGLSLPSSRRTYQLWNDKVWRLLLLDRTLGYLFLLPALLVILGLVAYPFANAIVMTF
jgi:ABC-type sugar transport system permease subunit